MASHRSSSIALLISIRRLFWALVSSFSNASTSIFAERTLRQYLSIPYFDTRSSIIGIDLGNVVTIEKLWAIILAIRNDASHIPTTGPVAISLQASIPVSSKQATTNPSKSFFSPHSILSSKPGKLMAPS